MSDHLPPQGLSHPYQGKKIESPVPEELKRKKSMSISPLIQLGGGSVEDKVSVIYHGEGSTQY